jgi:hypothetical protein
VAVVDAAGVDSVSLEGGKILYIDRNAGPSGSFPLSKAGILSQVETDGSGTTTLYAPPAGKNVHAYVATASTIHLLVTETQMDGQSMNVLYTMPRAGGTLTAVPTTQKFDGLLSYPFAVEGDNVYVVSTVTAPAVNRIYRVSISTGTATVIAEKDGLVFVSPQLVGGKVWFVAGQGNGGVYSVPADATGPSATAVTMDFCPHLQVGAGFFLCTPADVVRYDLAGTRTGPFYSSVPDVREPGYAARIDGDSVYIVPAVNAAPNAIWSVPVAGGAPVQVACARGAVSSFALDATNLVWKEVGTGHVVRVAR